MFRLPPWIHFDTLVMKLEFLNETISFWTSVHGCEIDTAISLAEFSKADKVWYGRKENLNCPMLGTAFVIPFGIFFPIQQFGSFFGQWGNLFIWFAIAFALSQVQTWQKR